MSKASFPNNGADKDVIIAFHFVHWYLLWYVKIIGWSNGAQCTMGDFFGGFGGVSWEKWAETIVEKNLY